MGGPNSELGLLDQAPVGFVVTDRKGTIARWNKTAEQLFGWRATEVLGRKIFALAAPSGDVETLRDLIAHTAAGVVWEGEVALCDRNGRTRHVHLRTAALRDRTENVAGVVIVLLAAEDRNGAAGPGAEIGARLAQARKQAAMTQQALADRLGVTRRSVQGYESGAVVPYRHLDRLAEVFDRSAAWFVTGERAEAVAAPIGDLRAELREALHEELIAVFAELGASSEQLRRAEFALTAARRTR